ncbi:class I SAM-dependent methyltransferase [Thermodesulfobacteriota bacterium]
MNMVTIGIQTASKPLCIICGSDGQVLYQGLKDRLYDLSGEWVIKQCRNTKCKLLWLDPMPVAEDLNKLYLDYYTHKNMPINKTLLKRRYERVIDRYLHIKYGYGATYDGLIDRLLYRLLYLFPGRKVDADIRVMYLQTIIGGKLLEIGFGSGITLERLQKLCWCVTGIDIDPVVVKHARSKGLNVNLGHLKEQKYPDNFFDAIIMSHVIEHTPDPVALLFESYRVLKPDGNIIINTPNSEALLHRFYRSNWLHLDPPRHLHIFTSNSLLMAAKRVGFSKVACNSIIRSRDALIFSRRIRRYGNIKLTVPKHAFEMFLGDLIDLLEWMAIRFDKNAGGDLLLTAQK